MLLLLLTPNEVLKKTEYAPWRCYLENMPPGSAISDRVPPKPRKREDSFLFEIQCIWPPPYPSFFVKH